MSDLGLTLAWSSIQVAVLLLPASAIQAAASRRGPASGAWVASMSLGLVVVLAAIGLMPRARAGTELAGAPSTAMSTPSDQGRPPVGPTPAIDRPDPGPVRAGIAFERFRREWDRLGRGAAGPATRFRGWGGALAGLFLAGTALGWSRLLIGLWAVGLCRRHGRRIEDRGLSALLDELRRSMGCRPEVELREVPDLTTPATAGWRRPMLLLPDDWRSWAESERRAVVAHELAHIIRGDYPMGLLAGVAVALNYWHPMVRRMAGRLRLEQELAADSMGARFAGGRSAYLLALSSLALKQEGRSPNWPARAFLPARGTLIRRIEMLRDGKETKSPGDARSREKRLLTALGLLALTVGVATLKGPARAADGPPSPAPSADPKVKAPDVREVATPFDVRYVPERMSGVVAFRPSAILRRPGMGWLTALIQETVVDVDLAWLTKELGVDTSRPGFLKLGVEEIESVTCGFRFGQPKGAPADPEMNGQKLHSIEFGGLTIRTVAPFDWPAFLRQWKLELEEVRLGRGACYRLKGPLADKAGPPGLIYLPDDRTLVCDEEKWIRDVIGRDSPSAPAYLSGADWERASRGLLAFAINNPEGTFAKEYDLGRPDDAVVLSLFRGVERWVVGVDDTESIAARAEVTARDPEAAGAVAGAFNALVRLGLTALDATNDVTPGHRPSIRLAKAFLANLRAEPSGRSVAIRAQGFGTFGDLGSVISSEFDEAKAESRAASAPPKAEKR